jgi:hypothetical protein
MDLKEEEKKSSIDYVLDDLREMTKMLSKLDRLQIKVLMNGQLKKEKEKLLDLYDKEIAILEKNDPIKLEILRLLHELDIDPVKLPVYDLDENVNY